MPTLSDLRTRVRQDLRDSASPQEFTDTELDRWLDRAMGEVSAARPRERESTLTTNGTDRDLDLSTLALLLGVFSVEYPVSQWPPEYVRFNVWGTKLTMHLDAVPAATQNAKVRWGSVHYADATATSLTEELEDVVVLGAVAYALDSAAAGGANRVLTGGAQAQAALSSEASERQRAYAAALRGLRSRVRRRQLYAPAEPAASQDRDFGPS